jgi:hypothetical protein
LIRKAQAQVFVDRHPRIQERLEVKDALSRQGDVVNSVLIKIRPLLDPNRTFVAQRALGRADFEDLGLQLPLPEEPAGHRQGV